MSVRPSVLGAPETGEVRGEPLEGGSATTRGASERARDRAPMRLTFRLARQIGHHHVRDTYPTLVRAFGCKGGGRRTWWQGDGEVDITEFDITEWDVTFFQETDITESDVTKKGN